MAWVRDGHMWFQSVSVLRNLCKWSLEVRPTQEDKFRMVAVFPKHKAALVMMSLYNLTRALSPCFERINPTAPVHEMLDLRLRARLGETDVR